MAGTPNATCGEKKIDATHPWGLFAFPHFPDAWRWGKSSSPFEWFERRERGMTFIVDCRRLLIKRRKRTHCWHL
jgi:hypothetical protein